MADRLPDYEPISFGPNEGKPSLSEEAVLEKRVQTVENDLRNTDKFPADKAYEFTVQSGSSFTAGFCETVFGKGFGELDKSHKDFVLNTYRVISKRTGVSMDRIPAGSQFKFQKVNNEWNFWYQPSGGTIEDGISGPLAVADSRKAEIYENTRKKVGETLMTAEALALLGEKIGNLQEAFQDETVDRALTHVLKKMDFKVSPDDRKAFLEEFEALGLVDDLNKDLPGFIQRQRERDGKPPYTDQELIEEYNKHEVDPDNIGETYSGTFEQNQALINALGETYGLTDRGKFPIVPLPGIEETAPAVTPAVEPTEEGEMAPAPTPTPAPAGDSGEGETAIAKESTEKVAEDRTEIMKATWELTYDSAEALIKKVYPELTINYVDKGPKGLSKQVTVSNGEEERVVNVRVSPISMGYEKKENVDISTGREPFLQSEYVLPAVEKVAEELKAISENQLVGDADVDTETEQPASSTTITRSAEVTRTRLGYESAKEKFLQFADTSAFATAKNIFDEMFEDYPKMVWGDEPIQIRGAEVTLNNFLRNKPEDKKQIERANSAYEFLVKKGEAIDTNIEQAGSLAAAHLRDIATADQDQEAIADNGSVEKLDE